MGIINIGIFLCAAYISAHNRDIDTKLSAYDPWGLTTTLKMSYVDDPVYFGKFWVGGRDHYKSIFFVEPISQPVIEILTQNFQHMILGV